MTDLPLSPHTHSVPSLDSTVPAAIQTPPLPSAQPNGLAEDEEDYTIKCICGYQEDDGSTILCETCQTWQHIECYYESQGYQTPGDDENHYCSDCDPRPLDSKSATECQRVKRAALDIVDPKVKKPTATKGHRKKKAAEHATNGWSSDKHDATYRNGTNGSPRDSTASTKRPKASHRSSNSIHTVPLKMPAQPSRRSASASHTLQSPTKTSPKTLPVECEPYTYEFMHIYDNDPGETQMDGNSFCDLETVNGLGQWSSNPEAVKEVTNGKSHQEIFLRCDQSVDDMEKAAIQKHTKTDESREFHGRHPKWTYITVASETPKDMIVGELRGTIGHKRNYVQDETNRWEDLRHPAPFVFFHPTLPIYIDTRQEGTLCRYIRRSCNPNLKLITILESNSENNSQLPQLRFCLSATRAIAPGEEVTLAWTPDEYVRKSVAKSEGIDDEEKAHIKKFYCKVLSNFGGCACEDPDECGCFKWVRSQHRLVNGKAKKSKKAGRPNGRTPSSRSGSEAMRYKEEDDEDDDRSTSASSRSKPQSRDATPPDQRSDREKRKIDAIEARFAQQEQHKPKRRKAKTGGGSANNGSIPASAIQLTFPDRSDVKGIANDGFSASVPNTPVPIGKPRYVDVGTSQKGSGSPQAQSPFITKSAVTSPTRARSSYVDSATQVDMDDEEAKLAPPSPNLLRRPVMSLTKRLLRRCHNERVEMDKKRDDIARGTTAPPQYPTAPEPAIIDSPTKSTLPADAKDVDGDVAMGNADLESRLPEPTISDAHQQQKPSIHETKILEDSKEESLKPKIESPDVPTEILPSPSDEKAPAEKLTLNGFRPTELHVNLPSPPLLNNVTTAPPAASTTAQSPLVQTPTSLAGTPLLPPSSSTIVQPSPVKKLSLGDYMSRRHTSNLKSDSSTAMVTTPGPTEKEQSPTYTSTSEVLPKPLESLAEDKKEQGPDLGSAKTETPKAEAGDPMVVDTAVR